jgi:hypothetical protein
MKAGQTFTMTQRQLDSLHLQSDGTSRQFPGLVFVVVRAWVNDDKTFSTTMPHKYPLERFAEVIRVYVVEAAAAEDGDPE